MLSPGIRMVEKNVENINDAGNHQKNGFGGIQGCSSLKAYRRPSNQCDLFQVRLVIAEKALKCEEHDVSLPLSEHNEPWFMRLNSTGEVPVLIHGENIICEATQIIDYLEQTFLDGNVKAICDFLDFLSTQIHVCLFPPFPFPPFSSFLLASFPLPLFLPSFWFYNGG